MQGLSCEAADVRTIVDDGGQGLPFEAASVPTIVDDGGIMDVRGWGGRGLMVGACGLLEHTADGGIAPAATSSGRVSMAARRHIWWMDRASDRSCVVLAEAFTMKSLSGGGY